MRFKLRLSIVGGSLLLLLAVLAACGPAPAVSLILSSSSGTVLRGDSISVDVTLTRSGGASADVMLSADVLASSGVTANLMPATLTGSILSSTLTIDVDASATDGPVTVTVSADGSGLAASQTFALTVDSLTLNGSVVGAWGIGVPSVTVSSQGASAVTAVDGSFQLPGLSVPYDVTVSNTTDEWAHRFEGMTVPNPVLMPITAMLLGSGLPRTATLSGTLTGAVVPVAAGHALVVCAEGLSVPVFGGCSQLSVGDSSYTVNPGWNGPASAPVRIHALEFAVDGSDQPTAYGGYGMVETALADGGAISKDVALGAGPATTTLSGTVVVPMGITASGALASLRVSPNLNIPITSFDPSAPFSLLMPDLPGATFDAVAAGSTGAGGQSYAWNVGLTGATTTITLPALPVPVAPASGSTGVTVATQFEASNSAGGLLTFMWDPSGSGPQFAVTTIGNIATIPDVSGLPLPPTAAYAWTGIVTPGFATVDEGSQAYLEDYVSALLLSGAGGPGPSKAGGISVTAMGTTFTTAP